jgi:hydroxymethylglutaryl-CoA lyase
MQSVLDADQASKRSIAEKVSVFTAASETFSQKNTNASIAETIGRFRPVVASAHAHGLSVRGYVSCVIACPFEGPIAPSKVAEVSKALTDIGVDELDLGDTIGAGTSQTTTMMLREVDRIASITHGRIPITLHLHDTFGRAAECVRAALDLGVRSFDGSVAGLGGCPYASKTLPDGTIQRAPGNISTELLVQTIHDAGYRTNVDLDKLREAAAFAREIVAKSRATGASSGGSGGRPA